MPTSLEHGPEYKCKKINRGCHSLEIKTNGTWYDIPNITHLKDKGRKEYNTIRERLNS